MTLVPTWTIPVKPCKPERWGTPFNGSGDATGGLITLGRSITAKFGQEKLKAQGRATTDPCRGNLDSWGPSHQLFAMNCHLKIWGKSLTRIRVPCHGPREWGSVVRVSLSGFIQATNCWTIKWQKPCLGWLAGHKVTPEMWSNYGLRLIVTRVGDLIGWPFDCRQGL